MSSRPEHSPEPDRPAASSADAFSPTAEALGLPRLLELWRELWALRGVDETERHRTASKEARALVRHVENHPEGLAALHRLADTHPAEAIRTYAGYAVGPEDAVPTSVEAAQAMLGHPRVALDGCGIELESTLLVHERSGPRDVDFGAWDYATAPLEWSWLGGTPSGPLKAWPRRTDGLPLAFVAQLDLAFSRRDGRHRRWAQERSLPASGVLQVFHDLETWGREPADRELGAWLIRHVAEPEAPVVAPKDLEPEAERPRIPVRPELDVSLPVGEPLAMDDEETDRFIRLLERWDTSRNRSHPPLDPAERVDEHQAIPRWFGYSSHGADRAAEELDETLLVELGDARVLLCEIPGMGRLEGWFYLFNLEVWIRRSDLVRQDYAAAWPRIAAS